jgi:hypothetical protein
LWTCKATLKMRLHDVAAVVVFLRTVVWIVPGFAVEPFAELAERTSGSGSSRTPGASRWKHGATRLQSDCDFLTRLGPNPAVQRDRS